MKNPIHTHIHTLYVWICMEIGVSVGGGMPPPMSSLDPKHLWSGKIVIDSFSFLFLAKIYRSYYFFITTNLIFSGMVKMLLKSIHFGCLLLTAHHLLLTATIFQTNYRFALMLF